MANCCQDNHDNQISLDYERSKTYINDFEINTIKKRITSLERRVTDIEYRLLGESRGATGAKDEHEQLNGLEKRIGELE